jgi:hypothetical protein
MQARRRRWLAQAQGEVGDRKEARPGVLALAGVPPRYRAGSCLLEVRQVQYKTAGYSMWRKERRTGQSINQRKMG